MVILHMQTFVIIVTKFSEAYRVKSGFLVFISCVSFGMDLLSNTLIFSILKIAPH